MNPAYEMLASRRILVVDKAEFDVMYMRALPAQRTLEITLPIPAVFKDGVFYIPDGALAIKYPIAEPLTFAAGQQSDTPDVTGESQCNCWCKGDPFKAPEQHTASCPESLESRRVERVNQGDSK